MGFCERFSSKKQCILDRVALSNASERDKCVVCKEWEQIRQANRTEDIRFQEMVKDFNKEHSHTRWTQDRSCEYWECESCKVAWTFEYDPSEDGEMNYCPKCGRKIVEFVHFEEEWECECGYCNFGEICTKCGGVR